MNKVSGKHKTRLLIWICRRKFKSDSINQSKWQEIIDGILNGTVENKRVSLEGISIRDYHYGMFLKEK